MPFDFFAASILSNSIYAYPRGWPVFLSLQIVTLTIPPTPLSPQQSLKCSLISSTVEVYSTFLTHIERYKIYSGSKIAVFSVQLELP
jgi:hypothetical protein